MLVQITWKHQKTDQYSSYPFFVIQKSQDVRVCRTAYLIEEYNYCKETWGEQRTKRLEKLEKELSAYISYASNKESNIQNKVLVCLNRWKNNIDTCVPQASISLNLDHWICITGFLLNLEPSPINKLTKFKHNSSKLKKPTILLKFSELMLTSLRKYWSTVI
mgnify:CR=1 FL=1